jgi:hypothetical protein
VVVSLVPCRECGARISTEAEVCPHCGIGKPGTASIEREATSEQQLGLTGPGHVSFDPSNPIVDPLSDLPTGSRIERHFARRVAFLPDGGVIGETDNGLAKFNSFEEWRHHVEAGAPSVVTVAGDTRPNRGAAPDAPRYNVRLAGISPLLVLGLLAFGWWAYLGFPSPDTLTHWSSAERECVEFAEKNKEKLFFGNSAQVIKAVSSWMKNGKMVVEIGAFQNASDTTYSPRICVIGGSSIQIVSIIESGVWR